jgi:hypothetical protein
MNSILYESRNRFPFRRNIAIVALAMLVTSIATSQVIADAPATKTLRLTLPSRFEAVEGIETGIYFDNIVLTETPEAYQFKVDCDVGKVESRRWALTATAEDVGSHSLTIKVSDSDGK